jgi:hypothetical protein
MYPRPDRKPSLWEQVKSFFSIRKPEQAPVVDQGKKLPKEPENPDRKATVFPGSGDF